MEVRRVIAALGLATVSGAGGWLLHGGVATPVDAPRGPTASGSTAARAAAPAAEALISVSDDGRVTLRVEQQPLEWVMEQLAQQTGRQLGASPAALRSASAPAAAAPECAAAAPDVLAPAQGAQLLQAIRQGSEQQRLEGLLQAREAGLPLDDATLRTLFETDASEQVRLRAFETYLEARSGSADDTRRALESALYVPSPAIQAEARALLQQLQDYERADAASGQQAQTGEP